MTRARLARIRVYPVKSLDALELVDVRIADGGALALDRRFALTDPDGAFVNGKRAEAVHRLRARYDADGTVVHLRFQGGAEATFRLDSDGDALAAWASSQLGRPLGWQRDDARGFPDDPEAWGPTVVSTASLEAVASWFPGLAVEDARRRFRANLELDGVPAFWEDRLFGAPGTTVSFRIGDVLFEGTNPCQRCVVPSRDPETGAPSPAFQKTFADRRRQHLPSWAERARFDHFYRFAINTRIARSEAGKRLRVGDELEELGPAR